MSSDPWRLSAPAGIRCLCGGSSRQRHLLYVMLLMRSDWTETASVKRAHAGLRLKQRWAVSDKYINNLNRAHWSVGMDLTVKCGGFSSKQRLTLLVWTVETDIQTLQRQAGSCDDSDLLSYYMLISWWLIRSAWRNDGKKSKASLL